jgi:hypothetical protein
MSDLWSPYISLVALLILMKFLLVFFCEKKNSKVYLFFILNKYNNFETILNNKL